MHCDTCLVNLCKACVGEHFSSNLSKSHTIVDFKDRNSTPVYPGCTSHDNERCKVYCNQCDIPVCTSYQHLGHKLSEILEVLDEKKLLKNKSELNKDIFPTYQEIVKDLQNRISQLEKEYEDLLMEITKHGEEWHREIDELVKKLKAEVDEMKNTQLQTLQNQLDEVKNKVLEIKEGINFIEFAVNSSDISKLFSGSLNVNKYRRLPNKIVLSFPKFIPGNINREKLNELFGVLSSASFHEKKYSMKATQKSVEDDISTPVKQLLRNPENITTIDTCYFF
ncbi:E3 ubiquitin-protein ligase TRIM45-like [Saccostrea cucullata]|uniref:E3 ubiquitin-protein ligase TRIM45-like n=1 Tax=Saccostrea cuccullata TaxID=36930 RepID=UPI002ED57AF8